MVELENTGVNVDKLPNHCPVCHKSISAVYSGRSKSMWKNDRNMNSHFDSIFECPSQDCSHLFIAHYERKSPSEGSINGFLTLVSMSPSVYSEEQFSKNIIALSPDFNKIYNQSLHAEQASLSEICGVGYRKALEFLIKDFCISENAPDTEKIKKMPLMQCISTYVEDTKVKDCSKRAVWLGNDETHYERKWTTKDIHDLKLLIKLVLHWIESFLLTRNYLDSMQ